MPNLICMSLRLNDGINCQWQMLSANPTVDANVNFTAIGPIAICQYHYRDGIRIAFLALSFTDAQTALTD